jgi:N-acetylmuramoyl-L-alanine amidase
MSKCIVIDIGHGSNTYPPSKGIGDFAEHSFNSAVGLKIKELAEHNGFTVLFSQQPNAPEVSLASRSAWINAQHKASPILCLLSIHANAASGNTSGHCVFHWETSANGKKLAEIWNRLAKKMLPIPQFGQGIWASKRGEWTDFHILRETTPPSILIEHFFYSNPVELQKCNTSEFVNLAAEVAVRAICEYAGVTFKELAPVPLPNRGDDRKIYRVQVGAFSVKENAEKLAAELKSKGYNTMIV